MSDVKRTAVRQEPEAAAGGYLMGPRMVVAIKSLIDQNEKSVNSSEKIRLETRFEEEPRRKSGSAFRVCTFTGSWTKNTEKTVAFKFQTNTPNTVQASNLFATITVSGTATASRNCAIAREGTAWYLIAAEC